MMADGINENPNLADNWDDAEGYYRKCVMYPMYTDVAYRYTSMHM